MMFYLTHIALPYLSGGETLVTTEFLSLYPHALCYEMNHIATEQERERKGIVFTVL